MKTASGLQFAKALEHKGWKLDRINGSHHIYKDSGGATTVSVPVHGSKDLRIGTLRALLRASGLTEADL